MSSKDIDLVTNRKRVCDFPLVRHSNLGPELAPFQRYCMFLRSWPLPYSILILGVFPLHQIAHVGISQSTNFTLISREIIFKIFQPVWSRYLNVTDGRTDGQTIHCGVTALCVASRGKNQLLFTNEPVLGKLGEHCERLLIARFQNSHQKSASVREHRLNFSVRQSSQVTRVDKRVATTVKMHLTVHLSSPSQSKHSQCMQFSTTRHYKRIINRTHSIT